MQLSKPVKSTLAFPGTGANPPQKRDQLFSIVSPSIVGSFSVRSSLSDLFLHLLIFESSSRDSRTSVVLYVFVCSLDLENKTKRWYSLDLSTHEMVASLQQI